MPRPGPSVTSGADLQPGADSLFPSGFGGGGASVRPGSVGTSEIADGSIAAADLNLSSVATSLAARTEFTGVYARKSGPLTIGLGDSITQGDQASPMVNGIGQRSPFAQACAQSGQQIRMHRNSGVSGDTVAMMLARIQTDVIAYSPDRVIFMGGTNDMAAADQTTPRTTVGTILDTLTAAGITTTILTIPPNVTNYANTARYNLWLKDQARRRGLDIVDVHATVADPSTGGYVAGYDNGDGIHFSPTGAKLAGAAIASALASRYPPNPGVCAVTGNDPTNMVLNAMLLTDSNSDGTPDSWSKNGSETHTLVTDADFVGKALQITRASASGSASISQDITTGYSTGDTVALSGKVRASSTAVTYNIFAQCLDSGNAQLALFRPIYLWTNTYTNAVTGYIRGTVPANTAKIQVFLHTSSGIGTVLFGQPTLRNLTVLGIS